MFFNFFNKVSVKFRDIIHGNYIRGEVSKGVKIGKNTVIDQYSFVGKYTYIGKYCVISKARIGNYTSIGDYVVIGPGEHDLNRLSTSSFFYDDAYNELTKKECEIGNDVWIGTQSIILRGVKVGNGAVIGANTVVTKDVPDFAVVVGSPAKIIKYRFNDIKIQKILNTKWYEKDLDEAKQIITKLEYEFNED